MPRRTSALDPDHPSVLVLSSARPQLEAAREVQRLPLAVHDAARVHGLTMIVFLGAVVWVLVRIQKWVKMRL